MIVHPKLAEELTLVPNQRACDLHLGRAFHLAGDRQVMIPPAMDVLSRWVEQMSVRIDLLQGRPVAATADRHRLDETWRQVTLAQSGWASAFESHARARSARAAERLLRQWCPESRYSTGNPDFRRWCSAVGVALKAENLFTGEDWLCHFRAQLEQPGELPLRLPAVIHLKGFAELTRLEQDLLESLRTRGVNVVDLCAGDVAEADSEDVAAPASCLLHSFESAAEEMRAAAAWAAECLKNGAQRVGIVVNELEAMAGQLCPVFDRILHPHDSPRVAHSGDALYHLADGSRLSDHAVIEDALLLLRLSLSGINIRHPFPDVSRLLLSPHLGGWCDERDARARFELRLRRQGRFLRSLKELGSLLDPQQVPMLSELLGHAGPVKSGPGLCQALLDRLVRWGWPGPLAEGSLCAERVRRFTGLLEALRHLGPKSAFDALDMLSRWCRDTTVTERGGPLSPIQLLGPGDAVGQRFDAAWVMNIHDGNWPAQHSANPYLPHDALKHVPRASPEGELRFARTIQGSLDRLAPEVHFSWSRSGDDVPRLASPLLRTSASFSDALMPGCVWPVAPATGHTPPSGYRGHPWLQPVEDTRGLPFEAGRDTRIPGGSGMVRHQSACPMMAYLLHRLQLRFEPMPGPFADYAYRGSLLHEALLQLFIGQVGKPGLPPISEIPVAVDRALKNRNAHFRLAPLALEAESLRLRSVLREWLEYDGQRACFVVAALEEKHSLDVQGLELEIRLDRVDRLDDGRRLIVDYKSGVVNVNGWVRNRIEEPQLPLYAILLDRERIHSVAGLALASVRMGGCRLAGIVDHPGAAFRTLYSPDNSRSVFGRRFDTWEKLFEHWRSGINGLLEEIVAGHAPNCLYQEKALKYAGLEPVLRRSEGEAWLLAHGALGSGPHGAWEDD